MLPVLNVSWINIVPSHANLAVAGFWVCKHGELSCGAYVTLELLTWRFPPPWSTLRVGQQGSLCDEEWRWFLAQPSLECVSASACCVKQRAASNTLQPLTSSLGCCFLLKNWEVFASQKTPEGKKKKNPHMPFLVLALARSSDGFSTQIDHFYLLLVNPFF